MKLLNTVALRCGREDLNLPAGLVGVIVEEWEPDLYEVEFSDLEGRAYAFAAIPANDLLLLRYSRNKTA